MTSVSLGVERRDRTNGVIKDRATLTDVTIQLGLARLDRPFVPKNELAEIVDKSGYVRVLSSLVNTLFNSDHAYARRTLMWSLEDVEKRGAQANPDTVDLARGALGTERI